MEMTCFICRAREITPRGPNYRHHYSATALYRRIRTMTGREMKPIFHITTAAEANEAAKLGEYAPEAFLREGFTHCSYVHQVCNVAKRRFKGRTDLVLFEIDRTRLPHKVIDENFEGGAELFPHIYGRLPMSAIIQTHTFACDEAGEFQLPLTTASRMK